MKPICVPCQRFYRCEKSGFYFTEGMPISGNPEPGTTQADQWQPYKIWSGDLWVCQGCGSRIIAGTGRHAIAEHYQPDFKEKQANLGAEKLQVNDC